MGVGRFIDNWTIRKIGASGQLTRNELDSYTAQRLEETVLYAYENSGFYKQKFAGRYLKEFAELPFTTQEELRERGMDMLCVKPGDISRIVTLDTGGSTGRPKRIYFTEEDQHLTIDFFENGMQLMADSSDRVLILMPAKVPGSIGKLLSEGLEKFGASAVCYGLPQMSPLKPDGENAAEARRLLEIIEKERITGAVALPTHMAMLAKYNDGSKSSLRWALLSAEYVSQDDADIIKKSFGCEVYEHYGMTEMGLGCAVSCGCGAGYHVREADLYIEIIDPDTGKPVPDGEYGEIVFTTLTRKGMPFIRYRTGDFSRWLIEECDCGSILKRLDKVGPREAIKGYLR